MVTLSSVPEPPVTISPACAVVPVPELVTITPFTCKEPVVTLAASTEVVSTNVVNVVPSCSVVIAVKASVTPATAAVTV